jgi:hypothetical protein
LNRRLGGPLSRSETFGEKYLFSTGIFSVENENVYYRYISSALNPANINESEKKLNMKLNHIYDEIKQ